MNCQARLFSLMTTEKVLSTCQHVLFAPSEPELAARADIFKQNNSGAQKMLHMVDFKVPVSSAISRTDPLEFDLRTGTIRMP
jgi:hypothetical protein